MQLLIAPIIGVLSLLGQDPGFDKYVANLPSRQVASEQQRSATGRCGSDAVGVVWSVWSENNRLKIIVNGGETDLSTSHPELAAFAGSGGLQRAYLICRPDDLIEVTFFRALAQEEGPTEYSSLKFTFSRAGQVVRVFPVQTEDADALRTWFRY